jgi:hypothetical protein
MPRELIARNLFGAQHVGGARRPLGELLAEDGAHKVRHTGARLTQAHADVLMGVLHLAGGAREGEELVLLVSDLEHELERKSGAYKRGGLRRLFAELAGTVITVEGPKPDGGMRSINCSLLPKYEWVTVGRREVLVLAFVPAALDLLDLGLVEVSKEQRRELAAKPLAQWLQLYMAVYPRGLFVRDAVEAVAPGQPVRLVRRRLREAVLELERAGVGGFVVDERDRVRRRA